MKHGNHGGDIYTGASSIGTVGSLVCIAGGAMLFIAVVIVALCALLSAHRMIAEYIMHLRGFERIPESENPFYIENVTYRPITKSAAVAWDFPARGGCPKHKRARCAECKKGIES